MSDSELRERTILLPRPAVPDAVRQWFAVGERISLLAKQFRQQIAACAAVVHLGESELLALWACTLSASAGIGQSDLARRLAISPAAASGVLERLRAAGFLESRRDATDRRRQAWHATVAGLRAIELAAAALAASVQSWRRQAAAVCPETLIEDLDRLLAGFATAPYLPQPPSDEPATTAMPARGELRRGAA